MILLAKMKQLKLNNPKTEFVIGTLLILSIYLLINSHIWYIWAITTFILVIPIINKFKILLYVLFGIGLALLLNLLLKQPTLSGVVDDNFMVSKIYSSGFVVKHNGANLFINSKIFVGLWDKVHIHGEISQPTNTSDFDYVTYLKTLEVTNIVRSPTVDVLQTSQDVRTQSINFLSSGPKSYREIAPLVLLGKKTLESKSYYEKSVSLSIVHLFVISGFHISLFYKIISKILNMLKIPYSSFVSLIPICIYLFILNFPLSATRAACLIIASVINKDLLKSKFNSLQILAFVMMLMFMSNRDSIYSLSFIFTFTATFVIIYINGIKFKNKSIKWMVITIGVYLSTLPISIVVNGYWAPLGIIFGTLLSPVFVFIYCISFILFPLKDLLSHVYDVFIWILNRCVSINIIININLIPIWIFQFLYLLPTTYLIINRKWNLSMDKKAI